MVRTDFLLIGITAHPFHVILVLAKHAPDAAALQDQGVTDARPTFRHPPARHFDKIKAAAFASANAPDEDLFASAFSLVPNQFARALPPDWRRLRMKCAGHLRPARARLPVRQRKRALLPRRTVLQRRVAGRRAARLADVRSSRPPDVREALRRACRLPPARPPRWRARIDRRGAAPGLPLARNCTTCRSRRKGRLPRRTYTRPPPAAYAPSPISRRRGGAANDGHPTSTLRQSYLLSEHVCTGIGTACSRRRRDFCSGTCSRRFSRKPFV